MHTRIAQLQTVPARLSSHGTIKLVSAGFEEFRAEIEEITLAREPCYEIFSLTMVAAMQAVAVVTFLASGGTFSANDLLIGIEPLKTTHPPRV
jgi:hypothetical protein